MKTLLDISYQALGIIMLAALFVLILCITALRAEEDCREPAAAFIKDHSTPAAEAKWLSDWQKKSEQMQNDNPQISSEAKAADELLLRYLRDRRKKLGDVQTGEKAEKLTAAEKLEICRWYTLYKDKGWEIDHDLADFITRENFTKYVLGDEIVRPDESMGTVIPPPRDAKKE